MTDVTLKGILILLAVSGILFSYLAIKGCGIELNHRIFLDNIFKKWGYFPIKPPQKATSYERTFLFISGMLLSFVSIMYLISKFLGV